MGGLVMRILGIILAGMIIAGASLSTFAGEKKKVQIVKHDVGQKIPVLLEKGTVPDPKALKRLTGKWETASIDGDALFFIVSSMSGLFRPNHTFKATVNYTDFQTGSLDGVYEVTDKHIYLSIKGYGKPYKVSYKTDGKKLSVTDEEYGVTLVLQRAKKKKGESWW